jgi:hypothetical protein
MNLNDNVTLLKYEMGRNDNLKNCTFLKQKCTVWFMHCKKQSLIYKYERNST